MSNAVPTLENLTRPVAIPYPERENYLIQDLPDLPASGEHLSCTGGMSESRVPACDTAPTGLIACKAGACRRPGRLKAPSRT